MSARSTSRDAPRRLGASSSIGSSSKASKGPRCLTGKGSGARRCVTAIDRGYESEMDTPLRKMSHKSNSPVVKNSRVFDLRDEWASRRVKTGECYRSCVELDDPRPWRYGVWVTVCVYDSRSPVFSRARRESDFEHRRKYVIRICDLE
jgi:hypothetical protein